MTRQIKHKRVSKKGKQFDAGSKNKKIPQNIPVIRTIDLGKGYTPRWSQYDPGLGTYRIGSEHPDKIKTKIITVKLPIGAKIKRISSGEGFVKIGIIKIRKEGFLPIEHNI